MSCGVCAIIPFSRMFAVEYAGQFDLVLPGLARFGLPLPLGGSSNHFRTQTLREVGGWDAFNVTEDADLGFRLARFGYRTTTIASITFEEAPVRFAPWLRQRSRWMKGWMQTWGVHMRRPGQLWRDMGPSGYLALNLIIGGNLLTALAYPVLIVEFLIYVACHAADIDADWFLNGLLSPLHLLAVTSGYLATVLIGLRALKRHGRLRDGWILLLTPLYWGCLSIATWRALWQLLREPYRWEKTEHGVTNRRTTPMPQAKPATAAWQPRRACYR